MEMENYFEKLEKHDANVRERLEIAESALKDILREPYHTEEGKRMYHIAFGAILKINELLVKATKI